MERRTGGQTSGGRSHRDSHKDKSGGNSRRERKTSGSNSRRERKTSGRILARTVRQVRTQIALKQLCGQIIIRIARLRRTPRRRQRDSTLCLGKSNRKFCRTTKALRICLRLKGSKGKKRPRTGRS